ncbi:unnamed protein product [Clonostachys solani]|uniref:Uncharacterized protein n=1 Tax=Clonostachys solani TaxID=160281 RepID=A0A9N9W8R4_9HYPO|nr:unnamed protein product [Clonostachys solani]
MPVEECRIQCWHIKNPQSLVRNLQIFCRKNNIEIQSLEMRNDEYIIGIRRLPATWAKKGKILSRQRLIINPSADRMPAESKHACMCFRRIVAHW